MKAIGITLEQSQILVSLAQRINKNHYEKWGDMSYQDSMNWECLICHTHYCIDDLGLDFIYSHGLLHLEERGLLVFF